MVLLDERRVWCLPLDFARWAYAALMGSKRRPEIPRISVPRPNGSLRITLPRKVTDLDLDVAVLVDEVGTPDE
jgi:hypothetical protein